MVFSRPCSSSNILQVYLKIVFPSSVKYILRPFFANKSKLQNSSKSLICAVTAGWLTNRFLPATVKLRDFAAWWNVRNWLKLSNSVTPHLCAPNPLSMILTLVRLWEVSLFLIYSITRRKLIRYYAWYWSRFAWGVPHLTSRGRSVSESSPPEVNGSQGERRC